MSMEHHTCTARSGSTLEAYDSGTDTLVLHIHDVSSFDNGPHDARIELPLGQLRELFNVGFGPAAESRDSELARQVIAVSVAFRTLAGDAVDAMTIADRLTPSMIDKFAELIRTATALDGHARALAERALS